MLIADIEQAREARIRLARIGFDNVIGALVNVENALVDNPDRSAAARRLPATEVAAWAVNDPGVQIIDVRSPSETAVGGTVPGAVNNPLQQLLERLDDLDP